MELSNSGQDRWKDSDLAIYRSVYRNLTCRLLRCWPTMWIPSNIIYLAGAFEIDFHYSLNIQYTIWLVYSLKEYSTHVLSETPAHTYSLQCWERHKALLIWTCACVWKVLRP